MNRKEMLDEVKADFVGYLFDQDIRNENGLKSLKQLVYEYPIEWDEYLDTVIENPLEINDVLLLTDEDDAELTLQKRGEEAEDRDRANFDDGNY